MKVTSLAKTRLDPLEKKVLDFARKEHLWQPGESLLLAVSGGPDSVCLLHIMLALAKREQLSLRIAHVNYKLRGYDSEKDALFVKKLAQKNNLPFHQKTFTSSSKKPSEEILRNFRYEFFDEVRAQSQSVALVLAHHADDQVETFLLRLFRGSGIPGLRAMLPKNDTRIRPLLFLWKKDILSYLEKNKISYRLDTTNGENNYTRNKIRNELIPSLQKNYQPNIQEILLQTTVHLRETLVPQVTIPTLTLVEHDSSRSFSLESFLALSSQEQAFFMRNLLLTFLPQFVSQKLYKEIIKTLKSTKNKTQTMTFHGLKLTKKGGTVSLQKILSD